MNLESMVWRAVPLGKRHPFEIAASEEVVLQSAWKGVNTIVFHEWEPAMTISKNQSVNDVDTDACRKDGVHVVRTNVGGRAVYHDNSHSMSYCVGMKTDIRDVGVLYEQLLGKAVGALRKLCVPAEVIERNYVRAEGKKLSGTALCVDNGAVVMHGSLLIDIPNMNAYVTKMLKYSNTRGEDWHGDVKSLLTCVRDFNKNVTRGQICKTFAEEFSGGDFDIRDFNADEKQAIKSLAEKKYSSLEWNDGKQERGLCWRKYGVPSSETRGLP